MVREILKDRKTQTRRVIKRTPSNDEPCGYGFWKEYDERTKRWYVKDYTHACVWYTLEEYISRFSKYHVGDILYVRETWLAHEGKYYFKADTPIDKSLRKEFKWKPSIHMPKAAARIFLKVTDVRIERLQDITEEEARKEGCFLPSYKDGELIGDSVTLFEIVWNNLYKNWNENPWVWIVEFKKVNKELED